MSRSIVDDSRPAAWSETCSVDFPVGPAERRGRSSFSPVSFVDARRARRRRLFAGRRRRAGARRVAPRKAPRRRRLLSALRQPQGEKLYPSDPHPRRRRQFGDAGGRLPAVRRRRTRGQGEGSSSCPALPTCSTTPLPPAAESSLGMHLAYDRAAAARAGPIAPFLATNLPRAAEDE